MAAHTDNKICHLYVIISDYIHSLKVCSLILPLSCIGLCLQGLSGHLLSQWSSASVPEDQKIWNKEALVTSWVCIIVS